MQYQYDQQAYQAHKDQQHLKILCVMHYVYAGLHLFGLAFLALHYMLMYSMFNNPALQKADPELQNIAPILDLFIWFYILGAIIITVSTVCNFLSARFITQRKNNLFSLIVAGLNCASMPLGTLLGIFTFIVLLRDSVSRLYAERKNMPIESNVA